MKFSQGYVWQLHRSYLSYKYLLAIPLLCLYISSPGVLVSYLIHPSKPGFGRFING